MPEPLILQIARGSLPLIAQAWGLPPNQVRTRPGSFEMAHHFLKVEYSLSYVQVGLLLGTLSPGGSVKSVSKFVQRGEAFYDRWPAYHQRYHDVRATMVRLLETLSAATSTTTTLPQQDL